MGPEKLDRTLNQNDLDAWRNYCKASGLESLHDKPPTRNSKDKEKPSVPSVNRTRQSLSDDDQTAWKDYLDDKPDRNGVATDSSKSKSEVPIKSPNPIAGKASATISAHGLHRNRSPRLQPENGLNGGVRDVIPPSKLRDKNTWRKLKSGRIEPDGQLDLHGMGQKDAELAFEKFVMSAHQSGKRVLLVITGKGRGSGGNGGLPSQSGILRHSVVSWMNCHPLCDFVSDYSFAHSRHGSTGAYYVCVRKRRVGSKSRAAVAFR